MSKVLIFKNQLSVYALVVVVAGDPFFLPDGREGMILSLWQLTGQAQLSTRCNMMIWGNVLKFGERIYFLLNLALLSTVSISYPTLRQNCSLWDVHRMFPPLYLNIFGNMTKQLHKILCTEVQTETPRCFSRVY